MNALSLNFFAQLTLNGLFNVEVISTTMNYNKQDSILE